MPQTFSFTTHRWDLRESLTVGGLADKAPEGRVPVGKASEGKDQGQNLGLPGGSPAARSQLLVGMVPLGPDCSWEGACRNLTEGVRRCCYEGGWSHPYQGNHSCPGTWLCRKAHSAARTICKKKRIRIITSFLKKLHPPQKNL